MGDIAWVVREIGISLLNDTTMLIIAFAIILTIFNLIRRIIHENDK